MKISEGVTQFRADHRKADLPPHALSEALPQLIAWRTILADLGLIGIDSSRYDGVGFGNVSARLGPFPGARGRRRFLISGTQTGGLPCLGPDDFAIIEHYCSRMNAVTSFGPVPPSSESMTHGALYDLGGHVRCVFHVHAPTIWRQAADLGLPCTRPGIGYGTPEMALEMGRLSRETGLWERPVLAMTGHEDGVIAFGRSAEEAGGALMEVLAASHGRTYLMEGRVCSGRDAP